MINNKIYGLLGLTAKAGKIVFGTESCLDMVVKRKVSLVIVTEDSAERTKNHFKEKCKQNNISLYIYGNREHLSKAIGKTNKTVIGIKDKNLAGAIQKILNGGDVIG